MSQATRSVSVKNANADRSGAESTDAGNSGSAEVAVPERPTSQDVDLLQAVVNVSRHLELASQIAELTRVAMDWCQPLAAFGLGPNQESKGWCPLACASTEEFCVELDSLGPIGPIQVKNLLPERPEFLGGLGEFERFFVDFEGRTPKYTWAIPLQGVDGQAHGMLLLLLARKPDSATQNRLASFLEMCADAISNAHQVGALQELIIRDDTAHCFNRRYFEEFLPEELSRASRFRAPVSLIFLDMDGLKAVNTRYGHSRGSRSLLEVSIRIRGKIRKFDKLFRFGGDEFCIVLPETEWHGAVEVAERVREAIAEQSFLVREVGGEGVVMTASLGIASYPHHARNKKDLIQLADLAMQSIKKGTKNGVAVADVLGE